LHYQILTIFPEIFAGFTSSSLIGKAIASSSISVKCVNIRDYAEAPHFKVDDTPYGGGAGMVMKPEPLTLAIADAKRAHPTAKVVLLAAAGERFNQSRARELSSADALILVCGRYEGIDQRVINNCVDHVFSIGDFVIMGGEVAAMALIEATARLIPSVIGNQSSLDNESFGGTTDSEILLEAPQYTRPEDFRGHKVPETLLSGDHARIAKWRASASLEITTKYRPDLLRARVEQKR